jgi:hypothetical protein
MITKGITVDRKLKCECERQMTGVINRMEFLFTVHYSRPKRSTASSNLSEASGPEIWSHFLCIADH